MTIEGSLHIAESHERTVFSGCVRLASPVWRFQSSAVFSFPGDVAGHFTTLLERFKLSGVFSFPGDVARQKYSREYPGEYCSSLSDPKLFIITILFCLVTFSCPIFTRIHAYSCKQVTLLVPHQILSYDPHAFAARCTRGRRHDSYRRVTRMTQYSTKN